MKSVGHLGCTYSSFSLIGRMRWSEGDEYCGHLDRRNLVGKEESLLEWHYYGCFMDFPRLFLFFLLCSCDFDGFVCFSPFFLCMSLSLVSPDVFFPLGFRFGCCWRLVFSCTVHL